MMLNNYLGSCNRCTNYAVVETEVGQLCQKCNEIAYKNREVTNHRGDYFGDYAG